MVRFITSIILVSLIFVQSSSAQANSFFDGKERYRGFFWFERPEKKQAVENKEQQQIPPTPAAARKMLADVREELEEARDMMMALAYFGNSDERLREAIIKYRAIEDKTKSAAYNLGIAWEEAAFLNPDIVNLAENPQNVMANKLKRKLEQEERQEQIRIFAGEYDLVLFEQKNCPYCEQFRPVAERFAEIYGFDMQVVDDLAVNPVLESLAIQITPTIIAVRNDGGDAFELIRGLVSIAELEENAEMAMKLKVIGSKEL